MSGYRISLDGTAITCGRCGLTSHNPNDVRERYCGNCRRFHETELHQTRQLSPSEVRDLRRKWEELTRGFRE